MATPDFILTLREQIGTQLLWLIGVTAVVLRGEAGEEEVLLCRRADNGRVTPVTGIVDPGEEPATAAVREVAEEAGVTAIAESLVRVRALPPMTYPNGDRAQYLDLVFRCRYVAGAPHPADGENTDVFWSPVTQLEHEGVDADMRDRVRAAVTNAASVEFAGGGRDDA